MTYILSYRQKLMHIVFKTKNGSFKPKAVFIQTLCYDVFTKEGIMLARMPNGALIILVVFARQVNGVGYGN